MTARAMVRFLAATTVAALLAVGISAVGAGAAVHRAVSESDCEALQNIGDNVDSSASVFGKQAKQLSDSFDEVAGEVDDKKLKKALSTMADFYDDLSGAGNLIAAGKITVAKGKAYAKAVKVWTKASLECVTTQITLPPDVTLPSGVTLPGGVTLPSVTLPR